VARPLIALPAASVQQSGQRASPPQVASLISFDESVVVYKSDSGFLEDESLVLDPAIDGTVYASVAKVAARQILIRTRRLTRRVSGHLPAH